MADVRSDDFWRSVARAFKSDRSVIFDVFNEPYSRYGDIGLVFDLTWGCWRNGGCEAPRRHILKPLDGKTFTTIGMQQMVDAIRSTGARQPIILSGRDFGNDIGDWLANRPPDDQLIAGFHAYSHQPCNTVACWEATVAPVAAQVPVVSGEFGENDCSTSHVTTFMDWADLHGIGYLMWAWWVLPDTHCSTFAMLADVKGAARAPNGTAFRAHLRALAPRVTLGGPGTQALDGAIEVRARCRPHLPGARDRSAARQAGAQAGLARAAGRAHAHARALAPARRPPRGGEGAQRRSARRGARHDRGHRRLGQLAQDPRGQASALSAASRAPSTSASSFP